MRHSFCCYKMSRFIKDNSNEILIYYGITRSYRFIDRQGQNSRENYLPFKYCLWCARRIPSDLTEKRLQILKEEFGITDPAGKDREKVPKEFLSDKWWKKRNL